MQVDASRRDGGQASQRPRSLHKHLIEPRGFSVTSRVKKQIRAGRQMGQALQILCYDSALNLPSPPMLRIRSATGAIVSGIQHLFISCILLNLTSKKPQCILALRICSFT